MNQTVLTPPAEYVDELFDALERFFPYIRFSLFTQNDDNTWILVPGKDEDGDNVEIEHIGYFIHGYIANAKRHKNYE